MPNSETAKTKSAPKRLLGWVLLALAVICVAMFAVVGTESRQIAAHIGSKTYILTRAVSQAQKEKGLSDTKSLAPDHGMLFWSDQAGQECSWMKRMHYSLDIVWLNQDKKVVHIEENVAPSTYPQTFCAYGQYVIELNAGEVAKNDLKLGQGVTF